MKRSKRRTLLILASALAGVTAFAAVGAIDQVKTANAESTSVFGMLDGAGIRVSDPTGIRFKAKFDANYHETITTTTAELHVAIVPYTYYTAYQASGESALYPWLESTYGVGKFLDLEIPDNKIYLVEEENGDSYYCANAVMSNVRFNNYHRDFVGVAYIRSGEEGSYTYEEISKITEENNARSVFEVACKANLDPEDSAKYGEFLNNTIEQGMYNAYGVKYNTTTGKYTYNGVEYDDLTSVSTATGVVIANSALSLEDAKAYVGAEVQLTPELSFSDGKDFTNEAYYTWSSSDTSVATVDENGKLVALKAGSTTITVSAVGGKFSDSCTVTVQEKPVTVVSDDIVFMAQGNGGKWNYDTGAATIDLTGVEFELTDVTQILCGETEVAFSVSGNNVTLTNAPGGDQTYTFVTKDMDYVMKGCIYGNAISTVEELEAWRTSESYWYTVLLNDIDYSGATLTDGANVLGTLDGRGYKIKNFTTANGFINRLYAAESAIKNVYFNGVTQDCSAWTGGVDRGVLGQRNNGTLENVYLQVHTTNVVKEHYGVLCFAMDAGSHIKNVVVEVTSDSTLFHYAMMEDNALADGNSAGVVGSYANGATESTDSAWGTASGFHQQLGWMVAEEANDELLTFTSPYWVIDTTARTITMQPLAKGVLVKEIVNIASVLLAQGNGGKWSYDTGAATVDLSGYSADLSVIESVTIDGEAFTNYTSSGSTLTLTNAAGGDHAITIETPTHIYNATVCVYGNAISTVEELEAWRTSESYWYTVLLNDIDYEGTTLTANGANVLGTLDGRGYKIKNFTVAKDYNFIKRLYAAESAIKNIYFENVTQDCSGWVDEYVTYGILGQWNNGTLENIYLDVTTKSVAKEHLGVLCYGMDTGSHIKNVVVDIKSDTDIFHYAMNANNATTTEGVVGAFEQTAGSSEGGASAPWGVNSGFHQYITWMVAEEANDELLTFTSPYWVIDTTARTITMQPYTCNYVTVSDALEGAVDNGSVTVSLSDTAVDASQITKVLVNGESVEYSVNGDALTVTTSAIGKMSITVVTGEYENVYALTVKAVDLEKVTLDGSYYNENGSLDLTGSGIDASAVTNVSCGGEAVEFTVSGNVLNIPAQTNGEEYEYVIRTAMTEYTLNVFACSALIETANDFVTWRENASGYAILLNDIDLNGATLSTTSTYFDATLDGNGYSILNFSFKGAFMLLNADGKVCDLQLVNATMDCSDCTAATAVGIFGKEFYGTVENMLIFLNIKNLNYEHYGVLCGYPVSGSVVRNVILEVDNVNGTYAYAIAASWRDGGATIENFFTISPQRKLDVSLIPDADTNATEGEYGSYLSEEEMLENVDFSAWTTPWIVESGKIPYMSEYVENVEVESIFYAQGNAGVSSSTLGAATIDLSSIDASLNTTSKVLLDGDEFTNYTVSASTITLTDAPGGDHVLTIVSGAYVYNVKICLYGYAISTLEELETWRANNYATYTVLLADIDCMGATLAEGSAAYRTGVLDGRGYSVANFTMTKGFVQNLNASGAIKNLQLINATQDCTFAGDAAVKYGVFGRDNMGTIENVLVRANLINVPAKDHYGVIYMGAHVGSVARNVVAYINSTGTANHYGGPMWRGDGEYTIENMKIVSGASIYMYDYTAEQVEKFASESTMHSTVDFSAWGEPWLVDENGAPYMREYVHLMPSNLVENGVTEYTILVSADEVNTHQTAISELQTLFAEATGVSLAVETTESAFNNNIKYISLGNTTALATSGIDVGDVGEQGYKIVTKGQTIFICGESKGVLYGVYELMNILADFEQYTSEYYYLETGLTTLALPRLETSDAPDIEYRVGMSGEQRNGSEQLRNRMRIIRSEDVLITKASAHNMLTYIVPFDTYYSTNPTWFSNLTDSSDTSATTQLCYTAGGDNTQYNAMVSVAVENIKAILTDYPSAEVFSLTQMDIRDMWCTCTACAALKTTYGTDAASQMIFVNDVTAQVETWLNNEQGGRKVQFMTFAYYDTINAPVTDNGDGTYTAINGLRFNDNVSVWVAPIDQDYTTTSAHEYLDTLLTKWEACANSCFIWAYNVYFHNYLVGYDSYDYIDDLVKVAVEHNAKFLWPQGNWNATKNTGFDDLKAYLYSKLMWDSTLDVQTLIDDFFAKVYGDAADTMQTVFDNWRTQSASMTKIVDSSTYSIYQDIATEANFPADWITSQVTLLEQAAALIEEGSAAYEAIQCELVMYKYIPLESTAAWQKNWSAPLTQIQYNSAYNAWKAALAEFQTLAETYGFNRISESVTLEDYVAITNKS